MLPNHGKRKLAATLVYSVLAYGLGCWLVYVGKISGEEFVSLLRGAGAVVAVYLGANVASGAFGKGAERRDSSIKD